LGLALAPAQSVKASAFVGTDLCSVILKSQHLEMGDAGLCACEAADARNSGDYAAARERVIVWPRRSILRKGRVHAGQIAELVLGKRRVLEGMSALVKWDSLYS
jgi:hypothetical protein